MSRTLVRLFYWPVKTTVERISPRIKFKAKKNKAVNIIISSITSDVLFRLLGAQIPRAVMKRDTIKTAEAIIVQLRSSIIITLF